MQKRSNFPALSKFDIIEELKKIAQVKQLSIFKMINKIKKVKKILLLAGGHGKRFSPITNVIPKEMLPIVNKPIFHYVAEEAIIPGIEEVILVINKNKTILLEYLKSSKELSRLLKGIKLTIVHQPEDRYGDAIAILAAEEHVKNEPFIVLWTDSFSLKRYKRIQMLLQTYSRYNSAVITLIPAGERESSIYAVPKVQKLTERVVKIERLLEKPGPQNMHSPFAFPNGIVLNPDILPYLKALKPNKNGEFSAVDALDVYCQENLLYGTIFTHPFFEAGNPTDFVRTSMAILTSNFNGK